jgi:hypothetical protein
MGVMGIMTASPTKEGIVFIIIFKNTQNKKQQQSKF